MCIQQVNEQINILYAYVEYYFTVERIDQFVYIITWMDIINLWYVKEIILVVSLQLSVYSCQFRVFHDLWVPSQE